MNISRSGSEWSADVKAGLVVFLIALPLSLGISIASGAPSTAGLISAVLGGIIGAYLGGSYVTINGPAAGLIVVVLGAIQSLSHGDPLLGFKRMLACVVVVGVLQVLSGIFRFGKFVSLFPSSVVHGMLSSIGLIIIIKQIHVFFGHKANGSIVSSILQLPETISNLNPEAALIGLIGMILLLTYPFVKLRIARIIPAPLVVVCISIFLVTFMKDVSLVKIPSNITEFFITPSFDLLTSRESIFAIISIYFVASLESVLSASAVDKLDPMNRESNYDRELWSKGIVNIACGMVGGLPIIAEIVRSSASISQGARTQLANFSHSSFLFLFLILFPSVLNMIPLSALAAILILVGYRLAQPQQFLAMKEQGNASFASFLTTIVVTLLEDLLVGIFAGIVVEAVISIVQGAKISSFLSPSYRLKNEGDKAILEFEDSLVFFSAIKQRDILDKVSSFKNIEINLLNLRYIDMTSVLIISKASVQFERNGKKVLVNVPERFHKLFSKANHH